MFCNNQKPLGKGSGFDMSEKTSPLRLICRNCGHPVTFDIELQTYRCPMCGETTGIKQLQQQSLRLHTLHKESLLAQNACPQITTCSGCGAKLVFPQNEALSKCDFCGGRLVRSNAKELGFAPDLVIAFVLTEDEAKEKLLEWAKKHPRTKEAEIINGSSANLQGYYMPYEIVKGPMKVNSNRAGISRGYMCRGFIENTAVNCVREMDYSIFDAVEPFDMSAAEPFEYGYIAGHRALISNISDNEIDRRVRRKVAVEYQPTIQKTLQDSDVRIRVESEQLLSASAMLPLYVMKKGRLSAVVNGQTGRVAVSLKGEEKKPFPFWAVEAAVYTVAVTLLLCALVSFSWKYIAMFGAIFAALFFVQMGQDRAPIASRIIKRGKQTRAYREDGRLFTKQSKVNVEPCSPPVFFENIDGREVPVEYKFLPLRRIVSLVVQSIALIFAPVIMAAAIAAATAIANGGSIARELAGMELRGGVVWFIFTVTLGLITLTDATRREAYNRPFVYERLKNGEYKLIGDSKARKLTLFKSLFPDKEAVTAAIKTKRGILIIIGAIATFATAVWTMLTL